MSETSRSRGERSRSPAVGLGLALLLFFGLGFLLFGSTGRDDVHITYWAAHSLAEYGDILNYSGEVFEHSSSLLQTVLLAVATKATGVPLPWVGAMLSLLGGGLVVVVGYMAARAYGFRDPVAVSVTIAVIPSLVYWSFSGMETSWQCALLLLVAVATREVVFAAPERRLRGWALLLPSLAAFLLVRPEAALVYAAGLAVLAIWLTARESGTEGSPLRVSARAALRRVRGPLLALGALTALMVAGRMVYFGSPVPEPVLAKVGGAITDRIEFGVFYLLRQGITPTFVALGSLGLLGFRKLTSGAEETPRCELAVTLLALAVGQLGFALSVGGDWMEAGRFLVPVATLLVLPAVEGATELRRVSPAVVGAVVIGILVTGHARLATNSSVGTPFSFRSSVVKPIEARYPSASAYSWWEKVDRAHLRNIPVLAHLQPLADRAVETGGSVTLLSGQAGMIPYYLARHLGSGRLKFIDRYGLTSRSLRGCDRLPKLSGVLGELVPMVALAEELNRSGSLCELQAPDLIVDLARYGQPENLVDPLGRAGFVLYYVQRGAVGGSSGLSVTLPSDLYIFAKRSLIDPDSIDSLPIGFTWP